MIHWPDGADDAPALMRLCLGKAPPAYEQCLAWRCIPHMKRHCAAAVLDITVKADT